MLGKQGFKHPIARSPEINPQRSTSSIRQWWGKKCEMYLGLGVWDQPEQYSKTSLSKSRGRERVEG